MENGIEIRKRVNPNGTEKKIRAKASPDLEFMAFSSRGRLQDGGNKGTNFCATRFYFDCFHSISALKCASE